MVLRPENFTEQAREAIGASQEILRQLQHSQWDSEHILMALLDQDKGVAIDIMTEMGVYVNAIKTRLTAILGKAPKVASQTNQIFATPRVEALLNRSKVEAGRLGDDFIGTEHLFIALTQEEQGGVAEVLKQHNVDTEGVYQALQKIRGDHRLDDPRAENRYRSLERFSIDLTQLARDG